MLAQFVEMMVGKIPLEKMQLVYRNISYKLVQLQLDQIIIFLSIKNSIEEIRAILKSKLKLFILAFTVHCS